MKHNHGDPVLPRRFFDLLAAELRKARLGYLRSALPLAILTSLLLLLLVALWVRFFPPAGESAGVALSLISIFSLIFPLIAAVWYPRRRLSDLRRLLVEAEERGDTRQLLETAADTAQGRLAGKGYSAEILDHLLSQAVKSVAAGLPPAPAWLWTRRALLLLLVALPVTLLALLGNSPAGIRPLSLLIHPGDPDHYRERTTLAVSPGSVAILAGESLSLQVREDNLPWRFPGQLQLEIDETGDLFKPVTLNLEEGVWTHRVTELKRSFRYRAVRGRSRSEIFDVTVFHPPVLDSLRITSIPPPYTGLPTRVMDLHSGELSLPRGTLLKMKGFSSSPLSSAHLVFENGDSLEMMVDGVALTGELLVDTGRRLAIALRDRRGIESGASAMLSIKAIADLPPRVSLLSPGPDEDLPRDLYISLEINATDDYGVTSLRILAGKAGVADTLVIPVPISGGPAPRVAERYLWDLGIFDLFPGDVIEYRLEARDQRPDGPGVGYSRTYRLRLPSIAEIYAEIEREDERRSDDFSDLLREGRELQEDLRQLEQELRADRDLDWEKEEQLQAALEKQEQISEKLEDLNQSLEQRSEALQENGMMRQEMAEKLERIQDLMEELAETEVGELLKRFQEMVDSMDSETLPEELKQMRMDQEQIMEQLERSEAMLERMLREQKMDALLSQVDELLEQQEQLRAETEDLEGEQVEEEKQQDGEEGGDQDGEESDGEEELSEELSKRQEELAEDAAELNEEIKETAEELSEDFPQEAEDMKAAVEEEAESNPTPPMEAASEKLQKKEGDASEEQQKATTSLLKLYWRLVESQSSMEMESDQMASEALGAVTRQLLELSLREESKQSELEHLLQARRTRERSRRAAREQMNLYLSLGQVREKLVETAKLTFGVNPQALRSSKWALESMELSVGELEAGQMHRGLRQAGLSVGHLNQAVIALLEGIRSQGSGSGSCSNPTQSMQDMLKRQDQLNRDSRSMPGGEGGLSMEQRAGMKRLKAEQQAIREGIEELGGSGEGVLGQLDKVIEEMKEVEKDFDRGRIDDETLRRQEKIFERLLDAQRSVHRQDFKQKRKSEAARELEPLWPDDGAVTDPLARLREEIRRGLGEAAPSEYEDLIQEYYRSLLENGDGDNP